MTDFSVVWYYSACLLCVQTEKRLEICAVLVLRVVVVLSGEREVKL